MVAGMRLLAAALAAAVLLGGRTTEAQVLEPPYFDIARGKYIEATSTCGEDLPFNVTSELYCKIAGVADSDVNDIRGQYCDRCVPGELEKDHGISKANDGLTTWWQSPPLSRSLEFKKVNVTLDLGQSFHVAYIIIKAANSPRPGVWSLERSNDGGRTFTPWWHFAPSPSECLQHFQVSPYLTIVDDDTVLCSTKYSQIPPFENGEIHISLVNDRPGASNFSFSDKLQEWTSATHIRLAMYGIKTLLTDLLPLSLKDPTVTRRYYYSIKDISVGGRCMCNGFADECQPRVNAVAQYECNCQHNACGPRCDMCCQGFEQKKWRPRRGLDKFECEPCNCFGHSTDCEYNEGVDEMKLSLDIHGNKEGGGVCRNCQDNTYGINCEKCKPFFYRPKDVDMTSPDACQPCHCNTQYSTGLCAEETGQCQCKPNYSGRYCDQCNKGYHMFPMCKKCECDSDGAEVGECTPNTQGTCRCKPGYGGRLCNRCRPGYYGFPNCKGCNCLTRYGARDNNCNSADGQCSCKLGYSGRQCEKCNRGYYQFPYCRECKCDMSKTKPDICDAGSGKCECKENFSGERCHRCGPGFWNYPICTDCSCSKSGSRSAVCNEDTGRCMCKQNFDGAKCDTCKAGYYGYPTCLPCACNDLGSRSSGCNPVTGQCTCTAQYQGLKCDLCLPGFYGFPRCQRCNCNPIGTRPGPGGSLGDCSTSNNGQCVCKRNVKGIECNECKSGFYDLLRSNPHGCSSCGCHQPGTDNGLVSCTRNGVCRCKRFVQGNKCRDCRDGYYALRESNYFGCKGCQCDVGGATSTVCSKVDGQCRCRDNIVGQHCDKARPGYYTPALHQISAEMEEAHTPDGDAIRFDYQARNFPGYSWKGFIFINDRQPAVVISIDVPKTSQYLVSFRYSLNQFASISGNVKVFSDNAKFLGPIDFPATQTTSDDVTRAVRTGFATVSDVNGRPMYFSLSQGKWSIELKAKDSKLLLDKVSVVPIEYVQATDLTKNVQKACEVKSSERYCNLYQYLPLKKFKVIEAEDAGQFTQRQLPNLFNDTSVLEKHDFTSMVQLTPKMNQQNILFKVNRPGKYVVVVQYYHDSDQTKFLDVYIRSRSQIAKGKVWLYSCRYTFGCRQVVLMEDSEAIRVYHISNTKNHLLTLQARNGASVAVDSAVLIPLADWTEEWITPKLFCTAKDSKCSAPVNNLPAGSLVQSPSGASSAAPRPPYLTDPRVRVLHMRPGVTNLDVGGVVAGRYQIVLRYYQPNHPDFNVIAQVSQLGVTPFSASAALPYCPRLSGCYTKLSDGIGNNVFELADGILNVPITIPREKDAWIEHVLLIPEVSTLDPSYQTLFGSASPISLASDFRAACADSRYTISPTASGFCRDAVFSLSTAFNNGAVPCGCDNRGSASIICNDLAGQCPCRANIIGRTCSQCRVGYYGFPNCKKCNCANCDAVTGACTCPDGVTGDNCDRCKTGTFGYDPIIGCQACKCDLQGTGASNAVCDVQSGQCPCKDNYGSRKCSSCARGYFNYPKCKKCDCDTGGVNTDFCDEKTGSCFCQENVVGVRCSSCQAGFFRTRRPIVGGAMASKLCTKCWCHGRSDVCEEADVTRKIINTKQTWGISLRSTPVIDAQAEWYVNVSNSNGATNEAYYWMAPQPYLGYKVMSYGGKLSYDFLYTVVAGQTLQAIDDAPDVRIRSGRTTIRSLRVRTRVPVTRNSYEFVIDENEFVAEDGTKIDRAQILSVLKGIDELKVRASHDSHVEHTKIWNIKLDDAEVSAAPGGVAVYGVENCTCTAAYAGASCEMCASGYTRQSDGTCSACECMARSETCNSETGECTNCRDNTHGDRCEKCDPGYYGDKCQPCECPNADPAGNFADSCSLNPITNSLTCQCKEGYTGIRCEKCADGFFGEPSTIGGSCKRCNCNGNINMNYTGNCDRVTGTCFKCLDNTDGDQCEFCRSGYYGDATRRGNCKDCKCDVCGAEGVTCNRASGKCPCKLNVIGQRCDMCERNTWNFDACHGCEECECGEASESQQCDANTGQCRCKATVIGQRCDWCALGYHGYTADGCQKCNCPNGAYCDVHTGECDCGIGGDKCTLCPPGYIIENDKCVECSDCVRNTLKRVNVMITNITRYRLNDNTKISSGPLNSGDLVTFNKSLTSLIPKTNAWESDLGILRKAIGFGGYGAFEGSMLMYPVEMFKYCDFGGNCGGRPATLPAKTATLPAKTTTPDPGLPVVNPTTAATTTKFKRGGSIELSKRKRRDVNGDDWMPAVRLNDDASKVVLNVGELFFNEAFSDCPVVKYIRNKQVHSIYVRTSDIPRGFNPFKVFTDTWSSTDNLVKHDFALYSTIENARARKGAWRHCNYDDSDVGYPRDCGKARPVGHRWFTMPGGRYPQARGISSGTGFDIFVGKDCPARNQAVTQAHAVTTKPVQLPCCPASLAFIITDTKRKMNDQFGDRVLRLETDAYDVKDNTTDTKQRALDLFKEIGDFNKTMHTKLQDLEATLKKLSKADADVKSALLEAGRILSKLQKREKFFRDNEAIAKKELGSSMNATRIAQELKRVSNGHSGEAAKFNSTFAKYLKALKNLKQKGDEALGHANNASKLIIAAKQIDYQTPIDQATNITNTNTEAMNLVDDLLQQANESLNQAKQAYKDFNNKTAPLEALIAKLQKHIADLKAGLAKAVPLVEKAEKHVQDLKKQADDLRKPLRDTQSEADKALRAANVYKNIIEAIRAALEAAETANKTASDAITKVAGVQERAKTSEQESEKVKKEATDVKTKAEAELKVDISDLKVGLEEIRAMRKRIQKRLDTVKENFGGFDKEKDVVDRADVIASDADAASAIAQDGLDVAKSIAEDVKTGTLDAAFIDQSISDLNKDIKTAADEVTEAEKKIPEMDKHIEDIQKQHLVNQRLINSNVTNDLEYVKYLIARGEDVANRMPVATRFDGSTALALNLPEAATQPSTTNELSLTFKIRSDGSGGRKRRDASQPNLLMFVGDPKRPVKGDYMALEVDANRVKFLARFNGEDMTLVNSKPVGDDLWYKVTVTRVFDTVTVTVYEVNRQGAPIEATKVSVTGMITTVSPIVTFNKESEAIVGGASDDAQLPEALKSKHLIGAIDEVSINGQATGLWNWKSESGLEGEPRGTRLCVNCTGALSFTGDGWVEADLGEDFIENGLSKIYVKFQTLAKDGMLFFGYNERSLSSVTFYFMLEISDGKLVSKYDLGSGAKTVVHGDKFYNDGKPHVFLRRRHKITIDEDKFEIPYEEVASKYGLTNVFLGGVPPNNEHLKSVSHSQAKGLSGCILEAKVKRTDGPLLTKRFMKYTEGCAYAGGVSASFYDKDAFMEFPSCSIQPNLGFGFEFQTYETHGVLFSQKDGQNKLKVTIKSGLVVMKASEGANVITLRSALPVSDGAWHAVVIVVMGNNKLTLAVDDESLQGTLKSNALKFTGNMFFGGENAKRNSFMGNVRKVYCQNRAVNLNVPVKHHVEFGSDDVIPPQKIEKPAPPTAPPTTAAPTTTTPPTTQPPTTTKAPTQKPVTKKPTTKQPTTMEATTQKVTDKPIETNAAEVVTTKETTSIAQTTTEKTTEATTEQETTKMETTKLPTTKEEPSTTAEPITTAEPETTMAPTTKEATTEKPTTEKPTTKTPTTTMKPTTEKPTTKQPTTKKPTTEKPTTKAPTTQPPTTQPPTTLPAGEVKSICKVTVPMKDQPSWGFGLGVRSYISFNVDQKELLGESAWELTFSTMQPDGLIMFAGVKMYDYEMVYIKGGKLYYVFNAGSGQNIMKSTATYNDGKWHTVTMSRLKQDGVMKVDGQQVAKGTKPGASFVNSLKLVYFGGLPENSIGHSKIPKGMGSLVGGIANIKDAGNLLSSTVEDVGTSPAFKSLGDGIFVGKAGGYALLKNKYYIGRKHKFELDIRPRSEDGYILHNSGNGDFLTLRLEKGVVIADCNNGGGLFSVSVEPRSNLCDGALHTIILFKDGQKLVLSVDGKQKIHVTKKGSLSADTNGPLILGGFPGDGKPAYSGCVNRLLIWGKVQDFNKIVSYSGSAVRGCAADDDE